MHLLGAPTSIDTQDLFGQLCGKIRTSFLGAFFGPFVPNRVVIDPLLVPKQMDMWKPLEKLHSEVIDSSSNDESDKMMQIMAAAASILHEHNASQMPAYRGSVKDRSKKVSCNRVGGHLRLYKDYFHQTAPVYKDYFHQTDAVYKEHFFWRRYRMSRNLFLTILRGVKDYDPYFQCWRDTTGALGFTSYQKYSVAIRMLSYGMHADIFDENLRMGESTSLDSM